MGNSEEGRSPFKDPVAEKKFDALMEELSQLFSEHFLGHSIIMAVALNQGKETAGISITLGNGQVSAVPSMKAINDAIATSKEKLAEEYLHGEIRRLIEKDIAENLSN